MRAICLYLNLALFCKVKHFILVSIIVKVLHLFSVCIQMVSGNPPRRILVLVLGFGVFFPVGFFPRTHSNMGKL